MARPILPAMVVCRFRVGPPQEKWDFFISYTDNTWPRLATERASMGKKSIAAPPSWRA